MLYLADINGYKGDFGNIEIVNRFRELSKELRLKELKTFLDLGFHIKPNQLVKELDGINFGFSYLDDIVEYIKPIIKSSKEIVILTADIE